MFGVRSSENMDQGLRDCVEKGESACISVKPKAAIREEMLKCNLVEKSFVERRFKEEKKNTLQ